MCWDWWGENLHYRSDWDWTPDRPAQAWLASPDHRPNLLNPNWDIMGSGTFNTDGLIYTAQIYVDLCEPAPIVTPQPVTPQPATPVVTQAPVAPVLLPDTAYEYGSPEWLGEMQLLMFFGFLLSSWLTWMLLTEGWQKKAEAPRRREAYCPIHRGDPADCEDKHNH